MNRIDIVILVVIVLVSFLDGVRDGNVRRYCSWWPWHIVKWISFYTPLILLLFLSGIDKLWWLPLAAVSWLVWNIGYNIRLP